MSFNPILMTDSYKFSHWKQYPPNTAYVNSYIESRGGRWNSTVFFGLQMYLIEYLSRPITMENIEEADAFCKLHGVPFNREGFEYIVNEHDGRWPVEIYAVPEGTIVNTQNVLVQIVNTDPKCFWVTSFLETALLRAIWYPTTVATNSFMCKKIIYDSLCRTAEDPDAEIMFKLHDFGARGVSSHESAGIGGAAHLLNFAGTDTVEGAHFAMKYYNSDMPGFSIPASEHSSMTTWGGEGGEIEAFRNMIREFKDFPLVACVSDSYDLWKSVDKWKYLEPDIIANGQTLIIRPDSGNPVTVVSDLIELCMEKFGWSVNSKGFKVLPDHIRVIQGDGIREKSIGDILAEMERRKLSTSNIAFGMGCHMLQHFDRDVLRFAMKASEIALEYCNGKTLVRDVYKDPVTDPGKVSKKGKLALLKRDDNNYFTVRADSIHPEDEAYCLLELVYRNGKVMKEQHFDNIKKRAHAPFVG